MQSTMTATLHALLPFLLLSFLTTTYALSKDAFPSNITLRAAVLTHAEPFAMRNEFTGDYYGLQADLLERLKIFAREDGVELTVELEEAPLYAYVPMFDKLSDDCNTTDNPHPKEDCERYDMLIGDYYTNADRSLKVDFTPPFLRTAVSALLYVHRDQGVKEVTTMEEASLANATICVVGGSYMDDIAMGSYPDANYYKCSDPDDCIAHLKKNHCPLFVDDELQLRHRQVQDPTLQVTQEDFNSQFIVWPMRSNLDPTVSKLMKRWMYAAKSNATLDELYNQYFSINLCPVGYSGQACDQPCHPSHGRSDRLGQCVCESTKWTGDDCSVEVVEDTNDIASSLVLIGYVMVGINFFVALICFVWLFMYRYSPQVQVAQPSFLCLVLVGCLISTFTIVPLAQENLTMTPEDDAANDAWCMSIPWFYSVGFSITFGTLFAKIRRVYVLFKSAVSTRRISISWKETLSIIGGVLLVDIIILTAWTLVDPLQWERTIVTTDKFGDPLSSEGYCTGDHWEIFAGIIAILHFGLLGFACCLCYVSRDIPTKFSEGRYLAIAMISNLQIFVVGVPVLIILGNDPQSSFFVRSIIIWMNDLVVMGLIFGNLMYSHWFDQTHNVDSKVAIRSAFQQYSTRHHANKSSAHGSSQDGTNANTGLSNISESRRSRSHRDESERMNGSGRMNKSERSKRHSDRSGFSSSRSRSNSAPPKRERPPDSWGGINTASSSRMASQDSTNEGIARIPRHGSKQKPRERPPDSWAALNTVSSDIASDDDDYSDGSASTADPSSALMEQIAEEGESKAPSESNNTPTTRRVSLLKDSSLPRNGGGRFEYANSRIGRIRESYASEVDTGDEPFRDET